MFFCKGQDNNTQCCFFSKLRQQQQLNNSLLPHELQKIDQNNTSVYLFLPGKNNRVQKSQEKSKLSLSKLSTKRSNDHKQITSINSDSYVSAPKSKPPQPPPISTYLLPQPQPLQLTTHHHHHHHHQTLSQQIPITSKTTYPASLPKTKIQRKENIILGLAPPELELFRINQSQKMPLGQKNYVSPDFPITLNTGKILPYIQAKQKQRIHKQNLNKSLQIQTSCHFKNASSLNQNHSKVQPPTISFQPEQINLTNKNKTCQPIGLEMYPQLKTSQSRYIQPDNSSSDKQTNNNNNNYFKSTNYNPTDDCQKICDKQIIESIILINFFHPNQQLKKQMEENSNFIH